MIGLVEGSSHLLWKGTRSVKKIPGLAGRVRVGAPDASLTPVSGVVAVAELVGRLGVTAALDEAVGVIKQRDRGLSAGEFLVAVAQAQMCGAQFWTGLDRRRADPAGEALSAVPTPASTTAVKLADRFGRFQVAGIEEGIGEITCRVVGLLPPARRAVLRAGGATIDLDGTDVEVYGSSKEGIAYSYKGARAGRPHVATWAEAGLVIAADLLAGDEDPRPGAGSLIERSVDTLRAAGISVRPKVRGDVGYFAQDIAWAAVQSGCDFSLGVTRNPAVWRAAATIPDTAWRKAKRMNGAQIAVCGYAPAGWPPGTVTVVRRVKVRAAERHLGDRHQDRCVVMVEDRLGARPEGVHSRPVHGCADEHTAQTGVVPPRRTGLKQRRVDHSSERATHRHRAGEDQGVHGVHVQLRQEERPSLSRQDDEDHRDGERYEPSENLPERLVLQQPPHPEGDGGADRDPDGGPDRGRSGQDRAAESRRRDEQRRRQSAVDHSAPPTRRPTAGCRDGPKKDDVSSGRRAAASDEVIWDMQRRCDDPLSARCPCSGRPLPGRAAHPCPRSTGLALLAPSARARCAPPDAATWS
jgi:hypothetical protein